MLKRGFDIVASLTGLVILSPVLIILWVLVASTSPGGALFKQVRVGRNGKEFALLKFRTMRPGSETRGQLTIGGGDPRVTPVGRVLRKTKMDELPQLFHVLMGDMSIVGPRPEVPRYVALYTAEQRAVLGVRPGITSAASVLYMDESELLARSAEPERTYTEEVMPAKLSLDLHYVRNMGLVKDLQIIARTLLGLFR